MRHALIILFIFQLSFSQTFDKSNLLKEIDETHDNGKPKKVDYKNYDLKVVLIETYDKSGVITSSYQLNPETGKRNGDFFDFPLKNLYSKGFKNNDGSFDFENPKNIGEYDEGVLTKCDNCTFYMYDISSDYFFKEYLVTGSVKNGFYFGEVYVSRIYESTITVKDNEGSKILSYDRGSNVNLYYKTGSGNWYKKSFYDFSFDDSGKIKDGLLQFYRDTSEKNLTKITYKNSKVHSILNYYNLEKEPRDSINRNGKFWKINNEFIKNNGWYIGPRFDPLNIEYFIEDNNIKKFEAVNYLNSYNDVDLNYHDIEFYDSNCDHDEEKGGCYKWNVGNLVFFGSSSSNHELIKKETDVSSYYYADDFRGEGFKRYFLFSDKVGVDFILYDKLDTNGIYTEYSFQNFENLVNTRINYLGDMESFLKKAIKYSGNSKISLFNKIDEFNNQYENSNVLLYDFDLTEKNYQNYSPIKEKEQLEKKLFLLKENLKIIETNFYKNIDASIEFYKLTKELFNEINSFNSPFIRLDYIDNLWEQIFIKSDHYRYNCYKGYNELDNFTLIKLMKFYSSNEEYLDDKTLLFKKMLENDIVSFNIKEFKGGVSDIKSIGWGGNSHTSCVYFNEHINNYIKLGLFVKELKKIKKIEKLKRFYKYLSKTCIAGNSYDENVCLSKIPSFFRKLNYGNHYENNDESIYINFRIDHNLKLTYYSKDIDVFTAQLKKVFDNYQE